MENLIFRDVGIKLEVKEISDQFIHLEGYASTFGNLDRVGDIIAKGAFANTLAKRTPKLLNQHNMNQPIGVIDSAAELEEGLFIKCRMPKANSMVMDLVPLIKMGAIGDFSIGFNVVDSETSSDGVRTIKEVDLWEISIVTIPANPEARITGIKKISDDKVIDAEKAESITTKKEFETMLKETGICTRKAAVILASRFNEVSAQGDPVQKAKQSDSVDEGKLLLDAIDKLKKSLTKE